MVILLYFILLIPFNFYSSWWVWDLVLESSGTSKAEFYEYCRESGVGRRLARWLVNRSPDPQKTKRLCRIHGRITAPSILSFNLALLNLYMRTFDVAVICAAITTPTISLAVLIAGRIYKNKRK